MFIKYKYQKLLNSKKHHPYSVDLPDMGGITFSTYSLVMEYYYSTILQLDIIKHLCVS